MRSSRQAAHSRLRARLSQPNRRSGQAKDYASNGLGVYAIDMATGEEGEAERFPTPEELWRRQFSEENAWRDRFAAIPYADKGGSWQIRFDQVIAVSRVLEAVATGCDCLLFTLATSSGQIKSTARRASPSTSTNTRGDSRKSAIQLARYAA